MYTILSVGMMYLTGVGAIQTYKKAKPFAVRAKNALLREFKNSKKLGQNK